MLTADVEEQGARVPPRASGRAKARQAVEAALPGVPCSWLDLTDATGDAHGDVASRLRGVAGRPPAVQSAVAGAASQTGLVLANLNLDEVAPVGDALCTTLDTVRTVRAPGGGALSTPQRKFEIVKQPDGVVEAKAVINMAPRDPSTDLALIGRRARRRHDDARARPGRPSTQSIAGSSQITDLGGRQLTA